MYPYEALEQMLHYLKKYQQQVSSLQNYVTLFDTHYELCNITVAFMT